MRVAIYGRKINKQTCAFFVEVLKHIDDFGWKAVLEEELKDQLVAKAGIATSYDTFNNHKDFHAGIDLLISLGGDGSFLQAVSYIRDSGVPIMGINTGRLGFLSNISKDHIYDKIAQVRNKQFDFQKRSHSE